MSDAKAQMQKFLDFDIHSTFACWKGKDFETWI
jgi:hypothetical protein